MANRFRTGWRGHTLRIALAAAIGLAAGGFAAIRAPIEIATAIGWDAAAIVYAGHTWWTLARLSAADLMRLSTAEDEGRAALTSVLSLAVAVSTTSIFAMITDKSGVAVIALAAFTILASWTLLHTVYAAHYAHRCYAEDPERPALGFPGGAPADFFDFAYYAFTIGMTFQTSDVETRTPAMRRLTLAHGVASFLFNTVIIAISVGLASGLMAG